MKTTLLNTGTRAPTTVQDWLEVAGERAADADAMLDQRSTSVCPVYVAGYAVECCLKAFLQHKGKGFPSKGSAGHDLRELWRTAAFRLCDVGDNRGAKAFFVDRWSTDLRYEAKSQNPERVRELVEAAGQLIGWIRNRIKRGRR